MEFRDLKSQYAALRDEIDSAIAEVITSSHFIGGSPIEALERELADFVGVKHCIACANGTDALQLALLAWGIGAGDAVIVPDFTFFSSGEVVSAVGAIPVFVDVREDTCNIDIDSIADACSLARENGLTPRAVIAVDLFGQPAEFGELQALCEANNLLLLEDGAQGFGGAIGDSRACSFGDISATSFFPAKPLGCYGDGGAVFTNNDEWASLIRSYAVHGKGSMKYDNVRVGMNSRLDAIQASILLPKLHAFVDYELEDVSVRAVWYQSELGDSDLRLPEILDGYTSSWAQYTVKLPSECNRDELQARLKEKGIPTNVYYPKPMHKQIAFTGGHLALPCPITERLCHDVLSLPMGPYLTHDDLCFVAKELKGLLSHGYVG